MTSPPWDHCLEIPSQPQSNFYDLPHYSSLLRKGSVQQGDSIQMAKSPCCSANNLHSWLRYGTHEQTNNLGGLTPCTFSRWGGKKYFKSSFTKMHKIPNFVSFLSAPTFACFGILVTLLLLTISTATLPIPPSHRFVKTICFMFAPLERERVL